MEGELEKARPIGLTSQPAALLIGQRGYDLAMVYGCVMVDCVHAATIPRKKPFEKRGFLQNR
jgi:hypothetical protein